MTKVFIWITSGKKYSSRKIIVEIIFEVLPKMVRCALALCHSNADVNKRMLIKQNVSVKDETIKGLRATKEALQDCDGVQNVPITLDMVKVV